MACLKSDHFFSSFTPGSHARHLARPVLAAVIVGPIVGIMLLLAIAVVLFRRRRVQKTRYPLDLSDGYRGSALDIAIPFPMPIGMAERPDIHYQPVQNSTEHEGSSLSGTTPYGQPSSWSPTHRRSGSSPSVPTTTRIPETDVSSTSAAGDSSGQEVQELRREVDSLWQLVNQAPPPGYTPPARNPSLAVRTGKN